MKRATKLLSIAGLLLSLNSCMEEEFHEDIIVAGGTHVPAETLNKGKQVYTEYCMPCHGVNGDGKGVASKGMTTPPRDFTLGIIKFGDVASGELPHDAAIFKTLEDGLNGTAMLPWDLKQNQKFAVLQYIKTFAPKTWIGKDKELGEQIKVTKDPYGLAHKEAAIQRGKEVYHVTANCQSCHRAYATPEEIVSMTKKLTGERMSTSDVDPEIYKVKPQESDHNYMTTPPDFTWHRVRSAKSVDELYLRISAGIGGTAMPSWKGTIEDDEIWAVSYYVKSLMELRNTEERKALINKLGK